MASTATNRREQLRRQQEAQARQKRTTRIIGAIAAVVALILIGVFVFVLINQNRPSGSTNAPMAQQIVPAMANQEKDALVIGKGAEGSPTITLYLDYQCPNCKIFEQGYGKMLEDEAKAGTWTFENKTMTFMDKNLQNTASTRAAIGAACAADTPHYSAYNTGVYEHQEVREVRGSEGYSDKLLRDELPAQVGMTGETLSTFQSCYDGKATKDFVAAVEKSAYEDGVTGTPTLLVNGKKVDFAQLTDGRPETLKALILQTAGA